MRGGIGRLVAATILGAVLWAGWSAGAAASPARAGRGGVATAGARFAALEAPPTMEVTGIADSSSVSGTVRITVTITAGAASEVDLLVDDASAATASTPPFTLTWDTTKASPGPHTVIVRAKDTSGQTAETRYVVDVSQAPASTAAAASSPTTPAPSRATPASTAALSVAPPATAAGGDLGHRLVLAGAGLAALGVCAAGGWYAFRRARPAGPVAATEPMPPATPDRPPGADKTEVIAGPPVAAPRAPLPTRASSEEASEAPLPRAAGPTPGETTLVRAEPGLQLDATVVPPASPPPAPRPLRAKLRVIQGGSGEFALDGPEAILGRDPTNPIVIKDALASRKHARIFAQNGAFWIEDLRSLNHTYVNGTEVSQPVRLDSDDHIKIGDVILAYSSETEG